MFKVSGPYGIPLKIAEQGVQVAFAAGTGVLVFMDFVAMILQKSGDNSLKEGFHFTLFAAFESEDCAFGLDLLRVAVAKCPDFFKLKLRFSGQENWNQEYL